MPAFVEYSLENQIDTFFEKTSATREACDNRAASLVGGSILAAAIQGDCSYTVYGGDDSQFVVQCQEYIRALRLLFDHLPSRFLPIIQKSLDAMPSIFSHLPLVLSHPDFGSSNIMVDAVSGRLTGIIDWAEAAICPFGQILYRLQDFSGTLHREHGWRRYKDHEALQNTFCETFQKKVGGLSAEKMEAIRSSRILGCLLSHGFIRRLPNEPFIVPVQETDEIGRYHLHFLDAFLIDVKTRFEDLN